MSKLGPSNLPLSCYQVAHETKEATSENESQDFGPKSHRRGVGWVDVFIGLILGRWV